MKARRGWIAAAAVAVVVLAVAVPYLLGAYSYYYSLSIGPYDYSAITTTDWYNNSGSWAVDVNGVVGPEANFISKAAVPGSSNDYEAKVDCPSRTSCNVDIYLRASTDARLRGGDQGDFYYVSVLSGSYVYVGKRSGSTVSSIGSTVVASSGSSAAIRAVIRGTTISVFVNNVFAGKWTDSSISSGQPGFGTWGIYSPTSFYSGISSVQFGPIDTTAPVPSGSTPTATATSPYSVTVNWAAGADDTNGSGLAYYTVSRNGTELGTTTSTTWVDNTVDDLNSYTYTVKLNDFHGNTANMTNVTVMTPHSPGPSSIPPDGRRTGVRPTGTYWGGGGENIDLLTGNLNFTSSLVKAQGRGIAAVFGLSYNSQMWRKDGTGGSATT